MTGSVGDRDDRIRMVFAEAASREPDQRAGYLDETCDDDLELRREVEALLMARATREAELHQFLRDLGAGRSPPDVTPTDPHELIGLRVAQYEIREWLGGGGMGVVYRAYDTRLGRFAALKFLPRHLTHDAVAKDRLIEEARASSRLDHANICTVHEVGETEEGRVFLAMTYYDGETLKKKLAAGPLAYNNALRCAVDAARGLACAHAAGIIHRDVKPANLIVTREGAVKILDFGIAQTAAGGAQEERGLGTPGYASPEQLRGEPLDQRSDIWSLGVVMYELFTGRRPFEEAPLPTPLAGDPSPPSSLNPAVPETLETIILKCLEKEKGSRYAHVADLLKDLEAVREAPEDGDRPPGIGTLARLRRPQLVVAAVVVLTAALLWITETRRHSRGSFASPTETRTHLAVLPFAVSDSTDEELSILASGMIRTLASMSATLQTEAESLWVVPATEVERARVVTSAEARRQFNVNVVLTGSLRRSESESELTLELVDPEGPRLLASRTLPGPPHPDFDAAALDAIRWMFGLPSPTSVEASDVNPITKPGAREFYLQGLGYLRRYDIAQNLERATTLFQRAIAVDSAYAMAHAALCEVTWERYRVTKLAAFASEGLTACDRASAMAEGQPAILVTLGRLYVDRGEYRRAEASLQRALRLSPTNSDALRWLGRTYEQQGRLEAAERAHRQAIALKPTAWVYYLELGQLLAYSSRHAEAVNQFEAVIQLTPDNHLGYLGLGYSRMRQGRASEAARLFEEALARQSTSTAYHNLGYLHIREGEFDNAIEALEAGLALDEGSFPIWRLLGHALFWSNRQDDARAAWQRMVELADVHLEVNPREGVTLMALAEGTVLMGQPDAGRSYLDRLVSLEQQPTFHEYEIGRLYEILDDRTTAMAYIERALANGFDPEFAERDPWLADLRRDLRYEELLEILGHAD